MSKERTYTREEFELAVRETLSVRETLLRLGLVAQGGGAYRAFHRCVKEWSVDTSHFVGNAWSRGIKVGPKRDLEDYLSNRFPIQSAQLRVRLINEGVLKKCCAICGLTEWNGLPAPLELDHIDGNHENNSLGNLRIICPNCHAQTDTHCGKNCAMGRVARLRVCTCGKQIGSKAKQCSQCANSRPRLRATKIEWPPVEEVRSRLAASSYSKLAEELGVSDNAIRKFLLRVHHQASISLGEE
jgi:hypothetical protein